MPLAQTLQNIFSKAMDFLATLATSFTLPFPTAKQTQPQIQHHHHRSKDGAGSSDDDPQQQHHRNSSSSATSWLEHRGYRDSFAKDDEVVPDPKEDVLIND